MNCPKCNHNEHRAAIVNSMMPDQVVRKRRCTQCKHHWFTVEVIVPGYAIGWSRTYQRKPVLRAAIQLTPSYIEAQDQFAGLRRLNERRAAEANVRYKEALQQKQSNEPDCA